MRKLSWKVPAQLPPKAVLGRVRDEWPVAMELLSMAAQQSGLTRRKTATAMVKTSDKEIT